MRYFFLFILFFFSSVIFSMGTRTRESYKEPYYIKLAHEVRENVASVLEKKHHMSLFGSGGALCDQVNSLGLSFQIKGPIPKDKIRYILIDSVEVFLNAINNDEKIRPFLKNYPFTPGNIDISLFIIDPVVYEIYDPEISVANAWIGKLIYNTSLPNSYKYGSTVEEPYEEALQIVKDQRH